ncbi:hypothetical protein PR202_ga16542 [Eleusine coracana subsp. coracana]|uniref:Uncharacterized protein n=1 Tax=Eleusine coracana subsp. coracana TaxID=191504 RepID=A0AAV5CN06_ELECO|nr:hypothetical protein PR202_ga16542 [Eleusine coracana subsp. coracana]
MTLPSPVVQSFARACILAPGASAVRLGRIGGQAGTGMSAATGVAAREPQAEHERRGGGQRWRAPLGAWARAALGLRPLHCSSLPNQWSTRGRSGRTRAAPAAAAQARSGGFSNGGRGELGRAQQWWRTAADAQTR